MLLGVLVIAALYFALMQLILIESSEKLRSAQRFRARVAADLLAEDSVELAAEQMTRSPARTIRQEYPRGSVNAEFRRQAGARFHLRGTGIVFGPVQTEVTLEMTGRIIGSRIVVDEVRHSRNQSAR